MCYTHPMTKQLEAILILANDPRLKPILMPIIDQENETIDWERLSYGVLSGGIKAAVSWAFCIWTDGQVPEEDLQDHKTPGPISFANDWRDPFEGFGVMDRELQIVVLKALAHRHAVFEKMGEMETYLLRLSLVPPAELDD